MPHGDLFITQADITQLAADAVVYSTDRQLGGNGQLYSAFCAHIPEFARHLKALQRQDVERTTGDAYWIPLSNSCKPHGVVAVVSTGSGSDQGAALAVSGALRRACEELRRLGNAGRRLVALPAIRLGYGGDRRTPLKSARLQLTAAREVMAEYPELDVAFIPYTPDHYQVYLEARRRLREKHPAEWPQDSGMEVPPGLADAVRRGECVLFVGSGLSVDAGLPGWGKLVGKVAAALGVNPDARTDLEYFLDLAQWYRESPLEKKKPLSELVREIFDDPTVQPTLAHYLLTQLPVRYVVTTNYDDLLERALRALRRYPLPVVEQSEVASTGRLDGVHVVKLHGDARRGSGIVLSRDDYEAYFQQRPAFASLLEGLLLNQTFLFTGYSLRDPDFRQIHHRVSAMLDQARRPAFATTFDAQVPYVQRQWAAKQVELLFVPGAGPEEQSRQLTRFLDALAEQVTGRQHLFLSPDAYADGSHPDTPLALLRMNLRETGEQVQAALALESLGREELEQVEWTLQFLTQHGWRPERGISLSNLWRKLADRSEALEERQRRLVNALPHTATLKQAQDVLAELDSLNTPRTPSKKQKRS